MRWQTVSNKRKPGERLKFSGRRTRANPTEPARKLSEIIKEMALRLFKEPDAAASLPAVEAAILLASAAWNAALGDHGLRDRHREMLGRFARDGRPSWPEFVSTDTDRLIAGLAEYKQARYPDDRRRIVAAETRSDGNVRVHWVQGDTLVAAPSGTTTSPAPTARAESGNRIAEALVARMKQEARGKIVDIRGAIAARGAAAELQKTVVTTEQLARFHPAHAAYVYVQNQVSVMSELLTTLDEMAPFASLLAEAEDLYMPSAPPMSPLTSSYFTCWAFFDACVEPTHETIGTTVLTLGAAFGMHPELLRVIRLMQESRMGLYVHEGAEGHLAHLRELVTGAVRRAIVPGGYRGQTGELWYARVLPPPLAGSSEHVVFTTPYLVHRPVLPAWQAYFRRTLPDAPAHARLAAYEHHMKYGPTRRYWNDFVFEGYVNHRQDAIYLAGLPDVPESRPHFDASSR
jgi:hypothetical protein